MLLCTVQSLAEMAVIYPVNGAFFSYIVRFVDPSWYVKAWQCAGLELGLGLTERAGGSQLDGITQSHG